MAYKLYYYETISWFTYSLTIVQCVLIIKLNDKLFLRNTCGLFML